MEGTFDKFPKLKICAAHGGGFLPSYDGRLDQGCRVFPQECTKKLKKQPSEYLKQIYVDTIVFNPESVASLDCRHGCWPAKPSAQTTPSPGRPLRWIDVMALPGLSDADRIAILGGTMSKLPEDLVGQASSLSDSMSVATRQQAASWKPVLLKSHSAGEA